MALVRVDLDFSATSAERVAALKGLSKHNLGIPPEDVRPFTAVWPKTGMRNEASRFELPAFLFEGRPVARFGFRNKDGFMIVPEELPPQVRDAAAARFNRLIALGKNNHVIAQDEQGSMRDEVHRIFGIRLPNPANDADIRRHQRSHTPVPISFVDVWNALERIKTDGMRIFWENGKPRVEIIRPAYAFHQPVFTAAIGNSGTTLFWETGNQSASGAEVIMDAHKRNLAEVDLGPIKAELRRADARFNPHSEEARDAQKRIRKMKSGDVFTHEDLRLETKAGTLLFSQDGFLLAQMSRDNLCPRAFAEGLGKSFRLNNGVIALATRIMENNPVRDPAEIEKGKAAEAAPKDWLETLEAAVQSTDFGYF